MIHPFAGKGLLRVLLLFTLLLLTSIPLGHGAMLTRERTMMKTSVEMILCGPDERILESAAKEAFAEIERIEKKLSPLREDSIIFKVNKNAGIQGVRTDSEFLALVKEAVRFSRLSQGCFDITIQSLASLWDFHQTPFLPPDKAIIDSHLPLVNYRDIRIDDSRSLILLKEKGMQITLGGIAKGYAVDRAANILRQPGITGGIVSAGGDLKAFGTKENGDLWIVGVKNPRDEKKWISSLPLSNAAVATSGDYERYRIVNGRRYHHILDPRTGYPARGCMSVTIIAKYATEADAMATAVFVMGPKAGLASIDRMPDTEGLIVNEKGNLLFSKNLKRVQPQIK